MFFLLSATQGKYRASECRADSSANEYKNIIVEVMLNEAKNLLINLLNFAGCNWNY